MLRSLFWNVSDLISSCDVGACFLQGLFQGWQAVRDCHHETGAPGEQVYSPWQLWCKWAETLKGEQYDIDSLAQDHSNSNTLELLQSCAKSLMECHKILVLRHLSDFRVIQTFVPSFAVLKLHKIWGPSQYKDVVLPVKGSPCWRSDGLVTILSLTWESPYLEWWLLLYWEGALVVRHPTAQWIKTLVFMLELLFWHPLILPSHNYSFDDQVPVNVWLPGWHASLRCCKITEI